MAAFQDIAGLIRDTAASTLNSSCSEADDQEKLMRCERILRRLQEEELPDFKELKEFLRQSCQRSDVSLSQLDSHLKDLIMVSKQLLGPNEVQEDLIGPAASFLLRMFHDSFYANTSVWSTEDYREHLSSVFHEKYLSSHVINQACDHCEFILSILEDNEKLKYFFGRSSTAETFTVVEWEPENPFSLEFRERSTETQPTERGSERGPFVDTEWLYKQVESQEIGKWLGLSTEDMIEMLRNNLKDVTKTDQEIEEDLLGLLGEDCLTFIRNVIGFRRQLVASFNALYEPKETNGVSASSSSNAPDVLPLLQSLQKRRGPVVGQSIVVQTEEEKRLNKLLRKFQKRGKLRDLDKRNEKAGELVRALAGPLFKDNSTEPPKYPFVFDTFIETKQSAAFVCGHKMVLPHGFKRDDNKRWEEMKIPASPRPPEHIIEKFKLIQIKDLDEVAKIGFSGITNLNQIQSVVYETAYKTNENLLVCAPTGAGKTNIAMLTILHEISNNLNPDGSVRLNDFKIVYIAPMKALVSEMVDNFKKRLRPFDVTVKECTGDMQLTKSEIAKTQMIVTTPEKWDVITRKASGVQLLQYVKLTIIDEIHILESDRGPVLEALVARIIRNVESTQQMSRLVGLSATLPNYIDVAELLGVSFHKGLFFFDSRFRPVPLELSFVGIKAHQTSQQIQDMDEVCYEKVREKVLEGHQVMVFVHARNATYKVATNLRNEAFRQGDGHLFPVDSPEVSKAMKLSRNKQLKELIPDGFATHHAGLIRSDRNLVERLFKEGGIKVLVCTSTLAWGVNLPAHAVVIRGTEMYDPNRGTFVDISMLDVMQIFGRAGRPQYDTQGFACIITTHEKLSHYLSLLTNQFPIESSFIKHLTDNLNAEIVAGTVATIDDAIDWISYTYLFIRMRRNPLVYGLSYKELQEDPMLFEMRSKLAIAAATQLHEAMMIVFDEDAAHLEATDLGRTASHYYIKYDTILTFNEMIQDEMVEDTLLAMICRAQEFEQLKCREEEMDELVFLQRSSCKLKVPEGADSVVGKVNILLQAYLSRSRIECFSLISDGMFIQQNIVRLARGLFEYVRKSGWSQLAHKTLALAKMFERQMWAVQTPFYQFNKNELDWDVLKRLNGNSSLTPKRLRSDELKEEEIGLLTRNQGKAKMVKTLAKTLPHFEIKAEARFVTETAVRVTVKLTPLFIWSDYYHGKAQHVWIWMEDEDQVEILEDDYLTFSKKQVTERQEVTSSFTIPAARVSFDRKKYVIHVDSDHWLGCESDVYIEGIEAVGGSEKLGVI